MARATRPCCCCCWIVRLISFEISWKCIYVVGGRSLIDCDRISWKSRIEQKVFVWKIGWKRAIVTRVYTLIGLNAIILGTVFNSTQVVSWTEKKTIIIFPLHSTVQFSISNFRCFAERLKNTRTLESITHQWHVYLFVCWFLLFTYQQADYDLSLCIPS